MDRRDFLKTVALTGAAFTLKPAGAMDVLTQSAAGALAPSKAVDMVAVMGGEPDAMFRRAIAELGGMKQFVKKGQKVCIKPNIGWDRTPELAGNTNPKLVAEIVKQCLSAGAKEVTVFDHTCDDWIKCYRNSGIEDAAKGAGAKVMPAHQESYYRNVSLPSGKTLKSAKIHQAILDNDVWINVPVLKHHGGANLTISMKNHMGIVWDRGVFHQKGLQQCIADICTLQKKAVLNVVDAYRIVKTNGPRGRSASDVVLTKALFVSADNVAVDTAATKFFNQVREMPLEDVAHIANGQSLKLGTMDIEKLNVKRIKNVMQKVILKTIRVSFALITFLLLTFFFLDFAGLLPLSFHRLAHLQIIPALVSVSIGIVCVWIILTLLFGRIYCSIFCPLGIFQDVINRLPRLFTRKKKKFTFSKAKTVLRWSVVGIIIVSFLSGFTFLLALLDPYSAYGRIATHVFKPVYMGANNIIEKIFTSFGNYTFYKVDAGLLSIPSFGVGTITLLLVGSLAWKYGRTWCNTLCPVGTLLGGLAKFSLFKIRIDHTQCNRCGLCTSTCKASCLDGKEQKVDQTRCVRCFNCLSSCKKNALRFSSSQAVHTQPLLSHKSPVAESHLEEKIDNPSRRQFLTIATTTAALSAAPRLLSQENLDKAVAAAQGVRSFKRQHPLSPPGAISQERFLKKCTSCHLCVSKCPSDILKPALMEYGLGGFMQPVMNFEKGFCNFDCTVCGDVCPNGAIIPLSVEEKHLTQVGYVVLIEENCIVYREGTSCGACSEHCPTQAITMVPYKDGLTVPQTHTEICVGCGGCEYVCPAEPFRAVYIEGNPIQKKAQPFKEQENNKIQVDDFGF